MNKKNRNHRVEKYNNLTEEFKSFKSRIDHKEERISVLENRTLEITQLEEQGEKRIKNTYGNDRTQKETIFILWEVQKKKRNRKYI